MRARASSSRRTIAPAALIGLVVIAPMALSLDLAVAAELRQPTSPREGQSGTLAEIVKGAARLLVDSPSPFVVESAPVFSALALFAADSPAPIAGGGALLNHLSERHVDLPPPAL